MSSSPRRPGRSKRDGGPRIAIGVTTFNRQRMVAACARSLRAVRGVENCRLIVLDDFSQDYTRDFLRDVFPPHADIIRRAENSGRADFAAADLYRRLCATEADLVISLDSDLLVASDALFTVSQLIGETDGVLSLFNTPSHPEALAPRGPRQTGHGLHHGSLVEKATIGNAGVAWRPDLLREVLRDVPPSTRWDWDFCHYLSARGKRLFALSSSAVQHLGFAGGQNSAFIRGDYGVSFQDFGPAHTGAMFEAVVLGLQETLGEMQAKIASMAAAPEPKPVRTRRTSVRRKERRRPA